MSFYQVVAEKDSLLPSAEQAGEMRQRFERPQAADALVFADAHAGNPVQTLRSLNPSVTIEGGKRRVDTALDPFDPRTATIQTAPRIIPRKFRTATSPRKRSGWTRLIDAALSAKERIKDRRLSVSGR